MKRTAATLLLAISIPVAALAQWRDFYWDENESPPRPVTLDNLYSGNTPYLRGNGPTNDNYTGWDMRFKYRYSKFSTNGEVSIASSAISANVVQWLGATNTFFAPYHNYFFEVVGTSTSGYVKTFCQGTFVQDYSPGAGVSPVLYNPLNWAIWNLYSNTGPNGPYRFNATAYAVTTNADGSITIPAPTGCDTNALAQLGTHTNATGTNVHGLGSAATYPASAFATAAQGTLAGTAVQRAGDTMTGSLTNQQNLLLGMNTGTRTETAEVGAIFAGRNYTGTQTIDGFGGWICGLNDSGVQTINASGIGAWINGWNDGGTQTVSGAGARISGYNQGAQTASGAGAEIRGYGNSDDTQTVSGVGSLLLINLGNGSISGNASIGLGAVTITHNKAIVLGDGQSSSAAESVTAPGGFYGPGPNLTGLTLSQITDAGDLAALDDIPASAVTNLQSQTWPWSALTNAPAVTNYLPGTGMTAATNGGTVTLNSTATGGGVVLPGAGMGVTTNGSTNIVYWLNESLWTPTGLPSAATVTIARADTSMCSLWVSNSPCVITFNATDWATSNVGRVSLDLWAGTNTITFDTNTITGASALSVSTTTNTMLQFRKGLWSILWAVRQ